MPPTSGMPMASSGTGSPTTSMSGRRVEQLAEHHRQLAAGQVGAEAEVRTGAAEADVRVGVAAHVEALGVVEHPGVAVGGAVEQDELVALVEVAGPTASAVVGRRCGA